MRRVNTTTLFIGLVLLCPATWAGPTIDNLNDPAFTQDLFKDLTSDLGVALDYKSLKTARPLGLTEYDIGFSISDTNMETNGLEQATSQGAPRSLSVPRLEFRTGLIDRLDVGGFYTALPSSNIGLLGGNIRYSLYDGGTRGAAVSIRGTYTQLTGVEEMDLRTRGLELSVSQGFSLFTPYAGFGRVWVDGESNVSGLSAESVDHNKYFIGFDLKLGLMNFAAETEQSGDSTSASAKIGVRF